jgi:hypothetical protein
MKIIVIGASSASLSYILGLINDIKYSFENIELITEEITWE